MFSCHRNDNCAFERNCLIIRNTYPIGCQINREDPLTKFLHVMFVVGEERMQAVSYRTFSVGCHKDSGVRPARE